MKYNKEILNRFLIEKVAIAVRTSEEWDKLMCLLEEETEVEWKAGHNPTEFNKWCTYGRYTTINCCYRETTKLEFSFIHYYKGNDFEIIEFKELIEEEEGEREK